MYAKTDSMRAESVEPERINEMQPYNTNVIVIMTELGKSQCCVCAHDGLVSLLKNIVEDCLTELDWSMKILNK